MSLLPPKQATSDHAQNFADAATCARLSKKQGCSLLCLPECFSFIGSSPAETLAQAEHLTGPRVGQYRALAKEHRLWISCGGFHELATDARTGAPEDKVFNTHLLLAPDGEIVTVYRKIHLFDVDIPNGPVLMESRSTKAGSDLAVCDTRKAYKHTAPAATPLTSSSTRASAAAAANVAADEKEPGHLVG